MKSIVILVRKQLEHCSSCCKSCLCKRLCNYIDTVGIDTFAEELSEDSLPPDIKDIFLQKAKSLYL